MYEGFGLLEGREASLHWGTDQDWTFEYFEPDDAASVVEYARPFYDIWNERRGDKPAARWSDYDWDMLRPWWGSMVITDIERDPFDYRYRLFGGEVALLFETDMTGQRASEVSGDRNYVTNADVQFYAFLSARPLMAHTYGSLQWQGRQYIRCGFFEVPLAEDGETVDKILSLFNTDFYDQT